MTVYGRFDLPGVTQEDHLAAVHLVEDPPDGAEPVIGPPFYAEPRLLKGWRERSRRTRDPGTPGRPP